MCVKTLPLKLTVVVRKSVFKLLLDTVRFKYLLRFFQGGGAPKPREQL